MFAVTFNPETKSVLSVKDIGAAKFFGRRKSTFTADNEKGVSAEIERRGLTPLPTPEEQAAAEASLAKIKSTFGPAALERIAFLADQPLEVQDAFAAQVEALRNSPQ